MLDCKPVGWRVLVEAFNREGVTTIIVPESSGETRFIKYVVVDVGSTRIAANGTPIPIPVSIGDEIVFDADNPNRFHALDPQMHNGRNLALVDCEVIRGRFTGVFEKPQKRIARPSKKELQLVN